VGARVRWLGSGQQHMIRGDRLRLGRCVAQLGSQSPKRGLSRVRSPGVRGNAPKEWRASRVLPAVKESMASTTNDTSNKVTTIGFPATRRKAKPGLVVGHDGVDIGVQRGADHGSVDGVPVPVRLRAHACALGFARVRACAGLCSTG
jgi:hypothetical protein